MDGTELNPGTNSTAKSCILNSPIINIIITGHGKGRHSTGVHTENTMVQNEQKKDVVTRVIFKAVLKRELFGEKSTEVNPELPLKPIEGSFVFKGGNTDIENYKYNNYNKDNTTFLFSVRRMWRSTPRPLQQNIFIYIFGRVFSKRSDNLKRLS